jgi:hypothetical protein
MRARGGLVVLRWQAFERTDQPFRPTGPPAALRDLGRVRIHSGRLLNLRNRTSGHCLPFARANALTPALKDWFGRVQYE